MSFNRKLKNEFKKIYNARDQCDTDQNFKFFRDHIIYILKFSIISSQDQ